MNFKRLLNTSIGQFFISLLLGLGLATLFRKACTDKNCIRFNGPLISQIDGKTYKFGEKCYKYTVEAAKCDPKKRTIDIESSTDLDGNSIVGTSGKSLLSTLGISQSKTEKAE
jgi:hypothetical protein